MGDTRGFTAFRFILEALVAIALVGTFFIYGYSGNTIYGNPGTVRGPAPASEPAVPTPNSDLRVERSAPRS